VIRTDIRRAQCIVCEGSAPDLNAPQQYIVERSVAIQCDPSVALVILHRFADEGLGSGDVTPAAQSEVDCPPHPINDTV
jgi:hypothetical protein